jgi:hypothetical protein
MPNADASICKSHPRINWGGGPTRPRGVTSARADWHLDRQAAEGWHDGKRLRMAIVWIGAYALLGLDHDRDRRCGSSSSSPGWALRVSLYGLVTSFGHRTQLLGRTLSGKRHHSRIDGQQRWVTLGKNGLLTPKEARAKTRQMLTEIERRQAGCYLEGGDRWPRLRRLQSSVGRSGGRQPRCFDIGAHVGSARGSGVGSMRPIAFCVVRCQQCIARRFLRATLQATGTRPAPTCVSASLPTVQDVGDNVGPSFPLGRRTDNVSARG